MPTKKPSTKQAKTKKKSRLGLLSKINFRSRKTQFIATILVFALIGGGVYTYRSFAAVGDRTYLFSGECLTRGQSIYSSTQSPRSVLAMQTDGNLVIYNSAGKAVWSTGTYKNGGRSACMQTDGNLVVYSDKGAVWQSYTANFIKNSGTVNYPVLMFTNTNSSDIVIGKTTARGSSWSRGPWRSNYGDRIWFNLPTNTAVYNKFITEGRSPNEIMAKGTNLISKNGKCKLSFQTDGNLVLRNATNTVIWSSNNFQGSYFGLDNQTAIGGQPGGRIGTARAIGSNGMLDQGTLTWQVIPNARASFLMVQDDCNLVAWSDTGTAVWSSGTSGR